MHLDLCRVIERRLSMQKYHLKMRTVYVILPQHRFSLNESVCELDSECVVCMWRKGSTRIEKESPCMKRNVEQKCVEENCVSSNLSLEHNYECTLVAFWCRLA